MSFTKRYIQVSVAMSGGINPSFSGLRTSANITMAGSARAEAKIQAGQA